MILEIGQILLEIRQRVLAPQNVPEYFQIFNHNSERLRTTQNASKNREFYLTGPLIWLTFLISARLWTYQEGTAFVPGPDQHAGVPKAFFGQHLSP